MTEQEARRKAENYADTRWGTEAQARKLSMEWDPNRYAYERQETVRAYMQCFRDMCAGEPDGWCAWHPSKGWDLITFDESQKESDKLSLGNEADDSGWRVVPVKLLRVEVDK